MARLSWRTVTEPAEERYEVKKSIFIANVSPIETPEQAMDFLRAAKSKYPDARHHVYAWKVGGETIMKKYSDDGEPAGTGGMPVLDLIEKQNLDDVIVVVTRYFGGVLLGTGGLSRAYSKAEELGITAAKPCQMTILCQYAIEVEYGDADRLLYALKKADFCIGETTYLTRPTLHIGCEAEEIPSLEKTVMDQTAGRATITFLGKSASRRDDVS